MVASDLFTFPPSLVVFANCFPPNDAPWEWLPRVKQALAGFAFSHETLNIPEGVAINGPVYLHPSVKLPAFASITGPAWIGEDTEIRPGAYIRGNVLVGRGCVLGNSSEFKNCLLLDGVQAPHFNYVGDSILGNHAHLGAGTILANLRLDQQSVTVDTPEGRFNTGLRKLGGLLGDGAEAGCNSVINPGTILGKRAVVMPGNSFTGYLEAEHIAFTRQSISKIRRR